MLLRLSKSGTPSATFDALLSTRTVHRRQQHRAGVRKARKLTDGCVPLWSSDPHRHSGEILYSTTVNRKNVADQCVTCRPLTRRSVQSPPPAPPACDLLSLQHQHIWLSLHHQPVAMELTMSAPGCYIAAKKFPEAVLDIKCDAAVLLPCQCQGRQLQIPRCQLTTSNHDRSFL